MKKLFLLPFILSFFSNISFFNIYKYYPDLEIRADTIDEKQNIFFQAEESNLAIINSNIVKKILVPKGFYAQQGITSDKKNFYYSSLNTSNQKNRISKIFKLNNDLSRIESEFILDPTDIKIWGTNKYEPHLGQVAIDHDNDLIYVPLMDVSTPKYKMIIGKIFGFIFGKPEVYGKKSALLILDDDLKLISYIDWSRISSYVDAIDINNGKIWFSCDYIGVINLTDFKNENLKNLNRNKVNINKFYIDRKHISKAQGLKVSKNYLYYVPENDKLSKRTKKKYWGLLAYDISNFKKTKFLKKINYPFKIYNFSIPSDYADLEAMDFVIGSKNNIYITSSIDNGKHIYEVQLN